MPGKERLKHRIEEEDAQIHRLRNEMEQLRNQHIDNERVLQDRINELGREIEGKETLIKAFVLAGDSQNAAIAKLEKALEEARSERDALQKTGDELSAVSLEMGKRLESAQKALADATAERDAHEKDARACRQFIDNLAVRVHELESEGTFARIWRKLKETSVLGRVFAH